VAAPPVVVLYLQCQRQPLAGPQQAALGEPPSLDARIQLRRLLLLASAVAAVRIPLAAAAPAVLVPGIVPRRGDGRGRGRHLHRRFSLNVQARRDVVNGCVDKKERAKKEME
jgi:hypothetical protein